MEANNYIREYRVGYNAEFSRRYYKMLYTAALRFGVILEGSETKEHLLILFEGKDYPDASPAQNSLHDQNNFKMIGKISLSGQEFSNTILVEQRRGSQKPRIITFWPHSPNQQAERNETDPLVRAAQDGVEVPLKIVKEKMYPVFKENPGMSPATLMAEVYSARNSGQYSETLSQYLEEAIKKIEVLEEESREKDKVIEKKDVELTEEKMKRAEKEDENQSLKDKLGIAMKEIEAFNQEKLRGQAQGQSVNLEAAKILRQVDTNYPHRNSICTRLIFDDGSEKYMKIATFDRNLEVTRKAQGLINKRVKITCWDPYNEPGKWSRQNYFRNIYEV